MIVLGIFTTTTALAYSDTSLDIEFIGNDTIDLDKKQTAVIIRATIDNYDPRGGHFYSKITDSHGNTITNSKVFPKYWKNGLWHVITGYSVNKHDYPDQYDVLGNWRITIYDEFGIVSKSASFSVIGSDTLTVADVPNPTRESMKDEKNKDSDAASTPWWMTASENEDADDADDASTPWWMTTKDNPDMPQIATVDNNNDPEISQPLQKNTEINNNTPLLDSYAVLTIILVVSSGFASFGLVMFMVLKKYEKKPPVPKISKYVWYKITAKPQIFEDDIFAEQLENLKEFGLVISKQREWIRIFVRATPAARCGWKIRAN